MKVIKWSPGKQHCSSIISQYKIVDSMHNNTVVYFYLFKDSQTSLKTVLQMIFILSKEYVVLYDS